MKHIWKATLVTAALIGFAGSAKADLNINGETGLILNPTAQIVQKGQPQIQASYFDFDGADRDKFYSLHGAIQVADKLEVSAGINKFSSGYESWNRNGFDIGVKYQLLSQREKGFDLAVGAGYDRGLNNNSRVYAAATKAFGNSSKPSKVMGTFGVRWDRYTNFDDDLPSFYSSQVSVFAGVEVPVLRNGELSLIGEIQSKNISSEFIVLPTDHAKFPYALGLRYHPQGQDFSITTGIQRQGLDTPYYSGSPKFFMQVGYQFGK